MILGVEFGGWFVEEEYFWCYDEVEGEVELVLYFFGESVYGV